MKTSFLLLVAALVCSTTLATVGKPNIVIIVADDLGYADVGFNPLHPQEVATPQLDALAKQSIICQQGYVTGCVYEGGIRVPFLVSWPGKLTPGESQATVVSLDILPTVLAACGVAAPQEKPSDGINLLPILRGESPPLARNLFWSSGGVDGWWAVRSGDWKLVGEKSHVGLFDLSKDISEKTDLAKQMPAKVAELTKLHDEWLVGMALPVHGGAKRFDPKSPPGKVKKKNQNKKRN